MQTSDIGSLLGRRQMSQKRRVICEKRVWHAIVDPSGDFLERAFRSSDLQYAVTAYWSQGTVFRNQKTGDYKVWENSKFRTIKFVHLDFSLLKGIADLPLSAFEEESVE